MDLQIALIGVLEIDRIITHDEEAPAAASVWGCVQEVAIQKYENAKNTPTVSKEERVM